MFPLYKPMYKHTLIQLFILLLMSVTLPARSSDKCTDLNECIQIVNQKIKSYYRIRPDAKDFGYTGAVNFKLDENFSIFDTKILKSSGNSDFDKAMLQAVNGAKSFPQLQGLNEDDAKTISEITLKFGTYK